MIDSSGNINSDLLQTELQNSLASDIKYKQVDNMKKRAVKVATDYNEFKSMVACAHLKKISSQEVASLSHVKKGWKKNHAIDKGTSAQLLTREKQSTVQSNIVHGLDSNVKQPTTCMELDRDLRRCILIENKKKFILGLSLHHLSTFLVRGADTDLLEQILCVLLFDTSLSSDNIDESDVSSDESNSKESNNVVLWLMQLSKCDNFDSMMQFAPSELVDKAVVCIQRHIHNINRNSQSVEDLTCVLSKYSNFKSDK